MPISMSPSARYTTQSSLWDNQFISASEARRLEKKGLYGRPGYLKPVVEKAKVKRKKNATLAKVKKKLELLFEGF